MISPNKLNVPEKCPGPVFILSPPRSGSTWLQRMLQGHPYICGGEESHFFPLVSDWLSLPRVMSDQSKSRAGLLAYVSEAKQVDIVRHAWREVFADLYRDHPDARYHLEKTPSHVFFVDDIVKVHPTCQFIVLYREPRATAASLLHAGRTWGHYWAPQSTKKAATMWHTYTRAIQRAAKEHENRIVCYTRYEDLVTNTQGAIEKILRSLSIECDAETLAQVIESGNKRFHGGKEPKEFRRQTPGLDWRVPLSFRDRLVIWKYTRRMAATLGYASSAVAYLRAPRTTGSRSANT